MGCSVWAVDFFAFLGDTESFTALFHLGASIAISRQHSCSFPPCDYDFSWSQAHVFSKLAFCQFTHVLYAMEVHT
jgi:hypothetical protein